MLPRHGAALLAVLVFMLLCLLAGGPAAAQLPSDQQSVQEQLIGQRAVVDSVERALGRDGLRPGDLDELRSQLDPVRSQLANAISGLEPQLAELNRRTQEIGIKPAADAPPEDASVTQERDTLLAQVSALDAVLKQVRLVKLRADQVADRITGRRRALFTDTLLARSYSVLNPDLWISAATALPIEGRGIGYLIGDWRAYADARMSAVGQMATALAGIAIVIVIFVLQFIFARPLHRADLAGPGEPLGRLKATALSALTASLSSAAAPIATLTVIALFNSVDLLPPRVNEIAQGFALAVTIVAVGRGLLIGALAPGEPRRRVMPVTDDVSALIYRHAMRGLWILAVASALHTVHRALVAPLPLTVATSAIMSIALILVAMRGIRALTAVADGEETDGSGEAGTAAANPLQWIRFPFWVLNALIIVVLVAGYVSMASFLSSRALIAVVMGCTFYLLAALINALFVDSLAGGPRVRSVAKTLGVRPASVELLAVLVAGVLKVVALIAVLLLTFGTFGTSTGDLQDILNRTTLGFTIGSSIITVGDVLSAVLFLVIGIILARAVQRWVAVAILPKTSFDTGLQNSIATIIGYMGSIAVIAMAMGRIGLNLENIALVAGALSVGIGFGLQSIVSNFVSGLILLAERPIRVGDTISVKGEEGYVRRISVRATEIETFDRAAVVIPNSDLITGMVKNFTHANTTGRVIVAVNVAYDSDADEVRDLLVGCACDHPQVLRSPPPRVFLMAFGDSYLKFELRCVVANVDYALTVKSDLHFAVLERLKAARIGIPYTPWNLYRGGRIGPPENEEPEADTPEADEPGVDETKADKPKADTPRADRRGAAGSGTA